MGFRDFHLERPFFLLGALFGCQAKFYIHDWIVDRIRDSVSPALVENEAYFPTSAVRENLSMRADA